jgi:hypothetical protein
LLLVAPAASATNGYFLPGYGTNSKAQGGVGIALPLDALTVATNPAGLTEVGDGITGGVEVFRPRRGAVLDQQGQSAEFDGSDTKTFYLPEVGFSRHLSERLAWGVALYGNGGLDTDYKFNPCARFGAQGPAGVDLKQAFFDTCVGVQGERFELGGRWSESRDKHRKLNAGDRVIMEITPLRSGLTRERDRIETRSPGHVG